MEGLIKAADQRLLRHLLEVAVEAALKELVRMQSAKLHEPTMRNIRKVVADAYGVSVGALLGHRRFSKLVRARHVAMYLCGTLTPHSMLEVAEDFAGRDRTTVMHGQRQIKKLLSKNKELQRTIEGIEGQFVEFGRRKAKKPKKSRKK